jgi:hypothetical protein
MPSPWAIEVWVLTFFSGWVGPFEGGQYQTQAACLAAGHHQRPHFAMTVDPGIKWKCTLERR